MTEPIKPKAPFKRVSASSYRGIYLLPNAFTTAALFCGFYAIVMARNLKFDFAAIALLVAMILDSLDGRIARLTNTQSDFGAQYDSLADMVSFGAAPALIIYEWALRGIGKLGWFAAFIFCAGAALRLARFNVNSGKVDSRFFQGIPSPAAAGLLITFIYLMDDLQIAGTDVRWIAWAITIYAGLTMVTNVPFYSFKDINFRKRVPFIYIFLIALILVMVTIDVHKVLFTVFATYALSGYFIYLYHRYQGKPVSIVQTEDDTDEPAAE